MPLSDGYGVLIGNIQNYYRDDPDNYGKYYHGNLIIGAPAGSYRCAIDVDSHQSAIGVEWRIISLQSRELSSILSWGSGFHHLTSTPTSGAVDYIRSPMFAGRIGCLMILLKLLHKELRIAETWKRGEGIDALQDLEPLVNTTRNNNLLALVFGEPFTSGLGVHNIHQNQGDPIGSPWAAENGIWQDGCTILQQSPDTFAAFMNKFTSQSYWTDDNGHPV